LFDGQLEDRKGPEAHDKDGNDPCENGAVDEEA
jgi:hypothetical protein